MSKNSSTENSKNKSGAAARNAYVENCGTHSANTSDRNAQKASTSSKNKNSSKNSSKSEYDAE